MSVEHANQPRLRKNLLRAVENLLDINPKGNTQQLVLAKPPLHLPPGVSALPLLDASVPQSAASENYPLGHRWLEFKLNSTHFPVLLCVVEGEADIRVGFPHTARAKNNAEIENRLELKDCHVLKLTAPSFLFLPPDIAYASGNQPPWERTQPELANSQILCIFFLPSAVLCHLHVTQGTSSEAQLPLKIKDEGLMDLWKLISEELAITSADSGGSTQALLHVLLIRLHRGLTDPSIKIADGISFWRPASDRPAVNLHLYHSQEIREVCEFIQSNLHEMLSPAIIARYANLSLVQLNRYFRSDFNLSTMQYVRQQRLEAAKIYLINHKLSVSEVGSLFGYKNLAHFSRVFKTYAGISPSEYRHQHRHSKNSCNS